MRRAWAQTAPFPDMNEPETARDHHATEVACLPFFC